MDDRRAYALGQLNSAIPTVPFAITTPAGTAPGPTVPIAGSAWVDVAQMRLATFVERFCREIGNHEHIDHVVKLAGPQRFVSHCRERNLEMVERPPQPALVHAAAPGGIDANSRQPFNRQAPVIPRSLADVVRGKEAILDFGREVARLGGSPLAEHGVGRNPVKQALLRQLYGDKGIDEMRAVKNALDPNGKLSPGVIFPR